MHLNDFLQHAAQKQGGRETIQIPLRTADDKESPHIVAFHSLLGKNTVPLFPYSFFSFSIRIKKEPTLENASTHSLIIFKWAIIVKG